MPTIVPGARETLKLLVTGTGTLNIPLPWSAQSVRVDNPGPQWVHLVGTDEFIPPGVTGTVRDLPLVDQAQAEWVAPWGESGKAIAGQQAVLTYYSDSLPTDPGTFTPDRRPVLLVNFLGTGGFDGAVIQLPGGIDSLVIGLTGLGTLGGGLSSVIDVGPPGTAPQQATTLWQDAPPLLDSGPGLFFVPVIQSPTQLVWGFQTDGAGSGRIQIWAVAGPRQGPLPGRLGPQLKGRSLSVAPASDAVFSTTPAAGAQTDVSDRPGRGLGIVASITAAVVVKLQDAAGAAISLGQKLMATSLPVAIASDQSAVPASQSGAWIIASITTAVVAKIQDSAGLAINLGRQLMVASLPVTMASDQPAIAVGAATGTAWPTAADGVPLHVITDPTTVGNQARVLAVNDGAATVQTLQVQAFELGFNGTAWDKLRTGAAAVLANLSTLGALLVNEPGRWSITHAPLVSIQATISRGAGGAGVRHVCKAITFGLSAGVAIAAATVTVNLRDGATNAGTILKTWQFALPAATVFPIHVELSGLNIPGSAATAMTLEFGALLANLLQYVSLEGTDAS